MVPPIVGTNPQYFEGGELGGKLLGGNNMPAMHLAHAVGGNMMLGFLSAVAFATILAVVAGLALAGASAISHDLYANVIRKGQATEAEEVRDVNADSSGNDEFNGSCEERVHGVTFRLGYYWFIIVRVFLADNGAPCLWVVV